MILNFISLAMLTLIALTVLAYCIRKIKKAQEKNNPEKQTRL